MYTVYTKDAAGDPWTPHGSYRTIDRAEAAVDALMDDPNCQGVRWAIRTRNGLVAHGQC